MTYREMRIAIEQLRVMAAESGEALTAEIGATPNTLAGAEAQYRAGQLAWHLELAGRFAARLAEREARQNCPK